MSEDTNTPTIANVADFLELLQSAVIETGPNTGTIDTGINHAYLAECISTLHRATAQAGPRTADHRAENRHHRRAGASPLPGAPL